MSNNQKQNIGGDKDNNDSNNNINTRQVRKYFNVEEELPKVAAEIELYEKNIKLSELFISKLSKLATATTFVGYSNEQKEELERHQKDLALNRQKLASSRRLQEAMNNYRNGLYGYEDEDGAFYYEDEEEFLGMLHHEDAEEEGDEEYFDIGEDAIEKNTEEFEFVASILKKNEDAQLTENLTLNENPTGILSDVIFNNNIRSKQLLSTDSTAIHRPAMTGIDFEILRLAKIGDCESFLNLQAAHNIDLNQYTDNFNRNALHYAADSGNPKLVSQLVNKFNLDPLNKDERGLSPLNIAVILAHTKCVEIMKACLLERKITLKDEWFDRKMTISAHIPDPPRAIISKSSPNVPKSNAQHLFWGIPSSLLPPNPLALVVDVNDPTFLKNETISFLKLKENAHEKSFFSWFQAISAKTYRNMPPGTFGVYTEACNVFALVMALNNTSIIGKKQTILASNPSIVNHLTIAKEFRKGMDASIVLNAVRHAIIDRNHGAAIFTTYATAPAQVGILPICRIKWFKRVLNPLHILSTSSEIVNEIYPDYNKYTSIMAVDMHLRSAFKEGPELKYKWIDLKSDEAITEKYVPGILELFSSSLPKVSDLFLSFNNTDALKAILLKPTHTFVVVDDSTLKVSDIVCFSIFNSRSEKNDVPEASAAVVVFSLFTSISGPERLIEIARLAGNTEVEVVYASNTHGFTMTDHRLAFFEEATQYAVNLYALKKDFITILSSNQISSTYPIDSSGVFFPFSLL